MRYSISELLIIVPLVLISLTVHEFAHSLMALKLGDNTSKEMGRLSLNPINHIDPLGLLFIIIVGFGWAKPVIIDKEKLSNPVRDDILIAISGPISNFVLAIVLGLILRVFIELGNSINPELFDDIVMVFILGIWLNIALGVFNLLPIPPLDGSHLITSFFKDDSAIGNMFLRYGTSVLFGILILERIIDRNILPIISLIEWFFSLVINIIF